MKMLVLVSALLGALLARASFGHADSLRYWGQGPRQATGVIELGKNHYSTIEVGADIPGWGRVKAVGDAYLVVEHALTPAQRDELSKRGALVHDLLEVHIPREDLRQGRRR